METEDLKFGEKLVCIDNFTLYEPNTKLYILELLELGKTYTYEDFVGKGFVVVSEIYKYVFDSKRFIKKSELRKYKLKKINEINSI